MLIMPRSCFLHVPKTGGTWIKQAIPSAGIACEDYRPGGDAHAGLRECPCPQKFKFAFVRHPVDLYRSYWQFKMTVGWDTNNALDQDCGSSDFHDFIRQVLDKYPGVYGRQLIGFIGQESHEIEFVGKHENLLEDLVLALKAAGEVFDERALRAHPPANVSDTSRFPAAYTADLERRVRNAERAVMERFDYD